MVEHGTCKLFTVAAHLITYLLLMERQQGEKEIET